MRLKLIRVRADQFVVLDALVRILYVFAWTYLHSRYWKGLVSMSKT